MLLCGLQAAAILLLSVPRIYPLNISFMSTDTLQSKVQGGVVTGPAIHQVGGINLVYLIAALFVVAAIAHLLCASISRSYYESGLKQGKNVIRAAQFTIEALLVITLLAVLAGVYDMGTLALVIVLTFIACLLIYVDNVNVADNRQLNTSRGVLRVAIIAASCVPFLLLAGYMVAGHMLGSGVPSYSVIAIFFIALLMLGLFILNRFFMTAKKGRWYKPAFGERWYLVLNTLTLTLLGWTVFASVLHP